MKACIPILVLALSIGERLQAAGLKGMILANELGGPPVADVAVAADGANPTTAGNLGFFSLEFPAKAPGEPVVLVLSKPGLVVVNDIQLGLNLPNEPDKQLVTFLLCRPEDREEMATRFYRIKLLTAVAENYRQRI